MPIMDKAKRSRLVQILGEGKVREIEQAALSAEKQAQFAGLAYKAMQLKQDSSSPALQDSIGDASALLLSLLTQAQAVGSTNFDDLIEQLQPLASGEEDEGEEEDDEEGSADDMDVAPLPQPSPAAATGKMPPAKTATKQPTTDAERLARFARNIGGKPLATKQQRRLLSDSEAIASLVSRFK